MFCSCSRTPKYVFCIHTNANSERLDPNSAVKFDLLQNSDHITPASTSSQLFSVRDIKKVQEHTKVFYHDCSEVDGTQNHSREKPL